MTPANKLDLTVNEVDREHRVAVRDANGQMICYLWQIPSHPLTLFYRRARQPTVHKIRYTIGYEPTNSDQKWFCFQCRDIQENSSGNYLDIPVDNCAGILSQVRDHLTKLEYEVWPEI